jgi:hypothetical protein
MLAKTDNASASVEVELVLTDAETEIFSRAVSAGHGLRRTFDMWLDIGKAIQVAQRHADAGGGGKKTRGIRRMAILEENGLGWVNGQSSEIVRLGQVIKQLPAVLAWRETLTDYQRARWSSPQSTFNRCPVFHSGSRKKAPAVQVKPMSVSEMPKLPSTQAAQLLYARSPSKAWALRRALDELLDGGAAPRPVSGWAAARERERPAAATVMAG